jgi:ubiquinone/menaquinone biosynthesis C-methylase UbiE
MSELSLQDLESAATAYDELLAPAVFQEWTHRVADAANIRSGQHVLDVACGTGVLARTVEARVGPSGTVTALDINQGMLVVAERNAPQIKWRQGEAEALPFNDQSFDAVVSQFGLMFFPDRVTALREMLRVLVPGGHLAVAVFDSLHNDSAYGAMTTVLERLISKEIADALRYPFILGDKEELLSLFAAAGITSAAVASQKATTRFANVKDMVLADVKGWFPLAGINLGTPMIDTLVTEAQAALEPFTLSNGSVEFPVSAHIVTATKA